MRFFKKKINSKILSLGNELVQRIQYLLYEIVSQDRKNSTQNIFSDTKKVNYAISSIQNQLSIYTITKIDPCFNSLKSSIS